MVKNGKFDISIKSVGEEGTFEAILSAYDVTDLANEKTVKGCFDKTIEEEGTNRVMLWGHSQQDPIGQIDLVDTEKSLSVRAKLCLATARGREAYELLKQGVPLGMSIGYIVRDSHFDSDGVRVLDDVKLLEGSLTPTPCNQACMVNLASVKSSDSMATSKFAKLSFLKDMTEEERESAIKELEDLIGQDQEDEKECEDEEEKSTDTEQTEPAEDDKSEDTDNDETEEDQKSFDALVQQINAITQKLNRC